MQSIFRLPWGADQIAPKMQAGKATLDTMRTSPVMDIPVLSKLKRKRAESVDRLSSPPRVHAPKKQRPDAGGVPHVAPVNALLPAKAERGATHAPAPPSYAPVAELSPQAVGANDADAGAHFLLDARARSPVTAFAAADSESANMDGLSTATGGADMPMPDARAAAAPIAGAEDARGLRALQQVIANEFNMQILMKHNELRLIEQELAKCQVALEQLRRCELRPYPGAEQPSPAVSAGSGAAIAPPPGYTRPAHPAPHGVTDGPYTRHYRQWLLHDPVFDPTPLHAAALVDDAAQAPARSTRNAGTARKSVQKSLTMPTRGADSIYSLPNYPAPAPKDKSAPLVLRRSTDGQLVKLICNNCQRGNFSSIQGFLNHCRIAHKVDYKSHDAAAIDCGRLLDEQEVANLPPETHATPAPKPSASRSSSTTTTPFKTQHLVHPMNTAGGSVMSPTVPPQAKTGGAKPSNPVPSLASAIGNQRKSGSFVASTQAPRLSAHFAKYQLGGNLEQAIANAKQKVDLGAEEDAGSPSAVDLTSPSTPASGSRTVLGEAHSGSLAPPGTAAARPVSRKGHREPAQRSRPSPLTPMQASLGAAQKQTQSEAPESPPDSASNLSPHAADSNPGLVSDHEDDDHGSASEDEVPQSVIAHSLGIRRGDCSDNLEIGIAVDDDLDQQGVFIRRNSMVVAEDRDLRTAGSSSKKLGGVGNKGA